MCPNCPHCVESDEPCSDIFGSNATPLGGSAGRADAMIGAVEAQKAEGVLHLHLFLFAQMAMQHKTLKEVADLFQKQLLTPDAWKSYVENVRVATYPDFELFQKEKPFIESAWPAFATDMSLCRPPRNLIRDFFESSSTSGLRSTTDASSHAEAAMWKGHYERRLQHVLSRMNHHIHPLNPLTQERKPLKSCCRKDRPNECKGGFPLESECLDVAVIVCECLATQYDWTKTGPRSVIGTVMPQRSDPWLNAGPSAWCCFMGDNGDLKIPHKVPITPETHEKMLLFDIRITSCASAVSTLDMLYDLTAAQSMMAGYFGGYSAKMQDVGAKELKHLRDALERKIDRASWKPEHQMFQEYSKRLLKDLEAKSVVRTAVESLNLSVFGNHSDVLFAECYRTFPTITFPAAAFLRREELETQKTKGKSVILAVHHGCGDGARTWTEAPYDFMYGFRGQAHNVDLLSAFEMFRYWQLQRVLPPPAAEKQAVPSSQWTAAGRAYQKECKAAKQQMTLESGLHYVNV